MIRLHIDRDNRTGTPATCVCGETYYKPEPPCHVACDFCGTVLEDEDEVCPVCGGDDQ